MTKECRIPNLECREVASAVRHLGFGFPSTFGISSFAIFWSALYPLDYGGLVHLLDDETLSADTSVAEIGEALEQLAKGEIVAAGEIYEGVVARWRAVAGLEHAN